MQAQGSKGPEASVSVEKRRVLMAPVFRQVIDYFIHCSRLEHDLGSIAASFVGKLVAQLIDIDILSNSIS